MFDYPLIRFDNRHWLELLQAGDFFMRTSLYYQRLEDVDLARRDPYDGSIPFPDKSGVIKKLTGKETENQRLMLLNRYVKCFYRCDETNFQYIGGSIWKVIFSDESIQEIKNFKVDSAMILFSPSQFVDQVKRACDQKQERVWVGNVAYLSGEDMQRKREQLFENPEIRNEIPFIKRSQFANQKEFRICVQHPFTKIETDKGILDIQESEKDEPYSVPIGKIEDTCIISIENLIKNGILFDSDTSHYYVSEDE